MKAEKKRKLAKKNQRRLQEMQRRFEADPKKFAEEQLEELRLLEHNFIKRLCIKVRRWMTR